MILQGEQSSVEIAVAHVEEPVPGASAGGDVLVIARVRCLGFTGETDAWVPRPAWQAFVRALVELERRRQGEAVLEGVSPGELRLRFHAVDRAGHLAVEGTIGVRGVANELRLDFSPIPFDPTQLPALVAELSAPAPAA